MLQRKIKGIALLSLGLLLITAVLSLLVYNCLEDQQAGTQSEEALRQLQAQIQWPTQTPAPKPTVEEPIQEIETTSAPTSVADESVQPTATAIQVDGDLYIGYLEIPTLHLTLPVMEEWSYPNLKKAPCRYKGSIATDDLIIAGHSYSRHFRYLWKLKKGDEVRFTDSSGTVYCYIVSGQERIPGNDSLQMQAGEWDLTLFTCTGDSKSRVTVRFQRECAKNYDLHSKNVDE